MIIKEYKINSTTIKINDDYIREKDEKKEIMDLLSEMIIEKVLKQYLKE